MKSAYRGKFYIVVSVDWEGRNIEADGIEHMVEFRKKNPHIPLQHFLNAAYYTRPDSDPQAVTLETRRVVLPGDVEGLHIHPWRRLVEASGVAVRNGPNIRGLEEPLREVDGDWAHEVPLHHYATSEIVRLINRSREILSAEGFCPATEFRSGAWLSGVSVTQALIETGFVLDCSAANRRFLAPRWDNSPLLDMLMELWPEVGDTTQPYVQTLADGKIWQAPNNACLADYTSAEQLEEVFERNLGAAAANKAPAWFMSTGFHQETAALYLDGLTDGLQRCQKIADKNDIDLLYAASPQSYLSMLQGAA